MLVILRRNNLYLLCFHLLGHPVGGSGHANQNKIYQKIPDFLQMCATSGINTMYINSSHIIDFMNISEPRIVVLFAFIMVFNYKNHRFYRIKKNIKISK